MTNTSGAAPAVLHNGYVHSPADPLASAILMEGDRVVWVGSEEAAASMRDDRMTLVDLRGDLVTPGLVNSSVDLGDGDDSGQSLLRDYAAQGIVAVVHTGVDIGPERSMAIQTGDNALPKIYHWPTVSSAELVDGPRAMAIQWSQVTGVSPLVGVCVAVSAGETSATQLLGFLDVCMDFQLRPGLLMNTVQDGHVVLEALRLAAEERGQRQLNGAGIRVNFGPSWTADSLRSFLASADGYALTVCLDPETSVLAAEFYRRGLPVVLGSHDFGRHPWSGIAALLNHPDQHERVSAKAAFTAATRGAWRALGRGGHVTGQLVPGAEATYARWEVESLMVQAASGTGASWSTDPRARTPLLPALEGDTEPVCVSTAISGVPLYQR